MKLIQLHGKPIAEGKIPLICTPLVGKTQASILAELETILPKKPDVIEWRVDFFSAISETKIVVDTARQMKAAAKGIPIIFTKRSMKEGGEACSLPEEALIELHTEVCKQQCVDIIDYELCNAREDLNALRNASKENGIAMIMSYHNFKNTPSKDILVAKYLAAAELGADIGKVAVMPQTPDDVLTLLSATGAVSALDNIPLIGMSMGGLGALSRMIGWMYGSALTFAVGKDSSAPGQMSIEELRTALDLTHRAMYGR